MSKRKTVAPLKLSDFEILGQLGRGSFGRVFLGELMVNGESKLYAIKAIRKDVIIEHEQVENTMLEKTIMMELTHPFLVSMDYLF
jgi:serine/threonine protein kinase